MAAYQGGFPGKQLPPSLRQHYHRGHAHHHERAARVAPSLAASAGGGRSRHGGHEEDDDEDQDGGDSCRRPSHRAHWRLRDAADDLLRRRREAFRTDAGDSAVRSSANMILSSHFGTETGLARIRRDKAPVVRMSFNAAAAAVLDGLKKQEERDTDGDGDDLELATAESDRDLPAAIAQWDQLAKLRELSLERSHENKDYAKKKGARAEIAMAAASGGGGGGTGTGRSKTAGAATGTGGGTSKRSIASSSGASKAGSKRGSGNRSANDASRAAAATGSSLAGLTSSSAGGGGNSNKAASGGGAAAAAATDGPKFTRNTPASSAAALDFRFNSSRAILCAAGSIAFDALTPALEGREIDFLDVPQNPSRKKIRVVNGDGNRDDDTSSSTGSAVNMGAVAVEAQTLGQRTIAVALNSTKRSYMRSRYRKDNARHDQNEMHRNFLRVENPFAWKDTGTSGGSRCRGGGSGDDDAASTSSTEDEDDEDEVTMLCGSASLSGDRGIPHRPKEGALTETWSTLCLPRLLSVLRKGAGHAVYHDVQWSTRHGRIADLLRELSRPSNSGGGGDDDGDDGNFGPHLIVTTEPEVVPFAREFYDVHTHLRLVTTNSSRKLRTVAYRGSRGRRRRLRRYLPRATGLPEAPCHVVITSYSAFLEDYLHFCQVPFELVILDDGASWMAAAQGDPNSAIGNIWDTGLWSGSDQQVGLAGTTFREWDYGRDDFPEAVVREAWVGLTARHRLLTSSALRVQQRHSVDAIPISGLVHFVAPHLAHVVREEWDRSRIASDAASMDHFRHLVARSIVVHHCSEAAQSRDLYQLALLALKGRLASPDRSRDPEVPEIVSDDAFISRGMVAFSRRNSLAWLGPAEQSWLRYELGTARLQAVLDAMKISVNHGHFCEEITTASSTTASGAAGQVTGTMAFRPAVRCGRHFGSEQGLRQHVSALHAPPGTWLCRTCGSDCVTSQARTHHERSCGQPAGGACSDQGGSVGATPTVGQGAASKGGVGKKKGGRSGAAQQKGADAAKERDADGSFRVPGYRGVWVNKAGKHFVKIDGKRLTGTEGAGNDEGDDVVYFDNIDDAARRHDEVIKNKPKKKNQKVELNFKADGSRIVYEDITPASTSGLGGSASNVVPALSVINIKDLPPEVKPLLRDPRQTSRTGGNSKRHVYAYRGVCRQARKGHDRWQSQISFMGVNHYLGTFDSEWDAAAIYAWAHLILYGEEATRQAQKEGEEAAAAYEQEKKDIAAGRIPEQPAKEKKKKKPTKKGQADKGDAGNAGDEDGDHETSKKRKFSPKDSPGHEKKSKTGSRASKLDKEAIGPTLAKGVTKAPILAPREGLEGVTTSELARLASQKLIAARDSGYCVSDSPFLPSPVDEYLRPCIPAPTSLTRLPPGGAMLLGLSPTLFDWDLQDFVESAAVGSQLDTMTAIQMLAVEFDEDGTNENFRSIVQGTVCVIGNASKTTRRAYEALGLGSIPIGGAVGGLDCHVGGVPGSCGEGAAYIRYAPTTTSDFQFACMSDEDMVMLNGQRVTPEMGCFPLFNEDICTVGARVFTFLLPIDK